MRPVRPPLVRRPRRLVLRPVRTAAGASLPGREPQGTAIWMVSGAPGIAFDFSSKTDGTPPVPDASVFHKSGFVS
ncbi:hypothetical protein ACGF3G_38225 [Streptomyces sp. NPDC048179]|uniref:hypothetical protein n=1 Tax=Streptomyces sp. NPDC048179 TaxID=3365506 RepID=UPI003711E0CC